jgi:integrase
MSRHPCSALTARRTGYQTYWLPDVLVRSKSHSELRSQPHPFGIIGRLSLAPAARNSAAARLEADVGLRVNEVRMLDVDDVRWKLGRFGKLNVRHGKGARRKGPKPRLVPLINGADRNLRWFIEDVWGQFGDDHDRPGAPLFPSERKTRDGSSSRATDDVFRRSLTEAAGQHLPAWSGKLTPHVLRHFCASELYQAGMTLFDIQAPLAAERSGSSASRPASPSATPSASATPSPASTSATWSWSPSPSAAPPGNAREHQPGRRDGADRCAWRHLPVDHRHTV